MEEDQGRSLIENRLAALMQSIMDQQYMIRKNISLILFTGLVTVCTASYTLYLYLHGGVTYIKNETLFGEFGKGLGSGGFFMLAFVYARTAFKLLVRKDTFWKRLEPFNIVYSQVKTLAGKIFYYLNKTHPYLGVLSITLIFFHCYFTAKFPDILVLRVVLALLAWQGLFGLILKIRFTPVFMKGRIHLFHAQLITGILILIFASFGHLLLVD